MKKIIFFILLFVLCVINRLSAQVEQIAYLNTNGYYALNYPSPITTLTSGMKFTFKANVANITPTYLQINSTTAVLVKKGVDKDLEAGEIVANQIVTVVYDGTYFQMLSKSGNVTWTNKSSATYLTDVNDFVGIGNVRPASQLHLTKLSDDTFIRLQTSDSKNTGVTFYKANVASTVGTDRDWRLFSNANGFLEIAYSDDDLNAMTSLAVFQGDTMVLKSHLQLVNDEKLIRTSDGTDKTGAYDLLPVAFGNVNQNGTPSDHVTPNVTVTPVPNEVGETIIKFNDIDGFLTKKPVVLLTTYGDSREGFWSVHSDNEIKVSFHGSAGNDLHSTPYSFLVYYSK